MLLHQVAMSHPTAAGAHRLRFDEATVEQRARAVRAWFRDRGRAEFTWWVGTSATPSDLGSRLLELGARPYEEEPLVWSMIATSPPPECDGIEVRPVEAFEEFVLAMGIAQETAGFTERQLAEARATLDDRWTEGRQHGTAVYLAYLRDEPIASAKAIFLPTGGFLSGATTTPGHRGQGAYRALVRARWDEAVRRGTPALIVDAGRMSRPILERLGFRSVAETRLLLDSSG